MMALFDTVLKKKASDLHLSAGEVPLLRVDGDIQRLPHPILDDSAVRTFCYEIMTDKQKKEFERDLELDFAFEWADKARFRVNVFEQNRGISAVFRYIPQTILTLEELAVPEIIANITQYRKGLVLITGSTGSGKSTSLAAMVDHINRHRAVHILTIEDPIEFIHVNQNSVISQRELHRNTQSFTKALRGALRADPDIILIGELRCLGSIRLALTAAETGHLVLATLHTASAPQTIDRLIDVFPAEEKSTVRYMLSESLRAVISQTLVKRKGGGRVAAFEIMIATEAIRHLIRESKISQMASVLQTNRILGMQTMSQHLQELWMKGIIAKPLMNAMAESPA